MKIRNLFKCNPKPKPDKPEPAAQGIDQAVLRPSLGLHVITIPEREYARLVEKGTTFRFTEDGVEPVAELWKVISEMNIKFAVEYDPYVFNDGRQYWSITWTPEYSYRGRTSGQNGPKIVEEVTLTFSPEFGNVRIVDGGRIEWRTSYFPEAESLRRMVDEVQTQITDIMGDFFRAEAFAKVTKKAVK